MPKVKKQPEPIPESFASLEEAAEWWDKHSLADYWDQTREVHFDIHIKPRRHVVSLEHQLAKQLRAFARKQGVSVETLVNLWLREKLLEVAKAS